jgi:Holliday junction DNA helicase RuvB
MALNVLEFICGFGDILFGRDKEKTKCKYTPDQIAPKKYSYRPQLLEQYIGQERAKDLVRLNLQKVMSIKPVHFLINGTQGCGKSTLAYIIGNHLDFKIHTYIGGSFTMDNLKQFLIENEEGKPHILFIDEIHGLSKEIAEFMYPILEDFLLPIKNINIRPFILIGATTEKNTLLKKFSPLVDRCGAQINLEHYNKDDIKLILKQYNDQVYQEKITEEIFNILAVNTRFNPRLSIAMFDDYIVCKNIKKVLNAHRIIKDSLTTDDIKILRHLTKINKPIGMETLAIIIQQTKEDYTALIEPFLIQSEYVTRTSRGRLATDKARALLQEIGD